MLRMRIDRRYRYNASETTCANVQCRAIMERPFAVMEFMVGMSNKVYKRPFCIECTKKLKRAKENVIMEFSQ